MQLLYFAWVRQRVGVGEEAVAPPPEVADVRALIAWLAERSPGHAAAFADPRQIRVAVNQVFATADAPIRAEDEVAFFPPVTGG